MKDLRNPDDTVRDPYEIAAIWREAGIGPQDQIGCYCGTGWRAGEAFVVAYYWATRESVCTTAGAEVDFGWK